MNDSNPTNMNSESKLPAKSLVVCAPRQILGRALVIPTIILVIVAVGYSTVYRAGPHLIGGTTWGSKVHRCDLSVFVAAGRAVLKGTDIYESQNARGWYYVYPPPFALLMTPFAVIPLIWASMVWYILSVLFIAGSVRLSLEMLGEAKLRPDDLLWLAFLPSALVLWLLISALQHGQTTPLVLWLVMVALAYGRSGRDALGGVALAAGILIKVFPALLLVYFVWRRRWRLVGTTVAALVVGGLVLPSAIYGVRGNLAYWNEWLARVALPAVSSQSVIEKNPLNTTLLGPGLLNNQSLSAVLWRIRGGEKGRAVALVILAVMASITALAGWRIRPGNELAVLSSFIAWMVLVPTISWSHYFMLLLLPLTVLVFLARHEQDRMTRFLVSISIVIFWVCCSISPIHHMQFWGSLCWGTMGLWATLVVAVVRRSAPAPQFGTGGLDHRQLCGNEAHHGDGWFEP